MSKNLELKFVKENGDIFNIGSNQLWRFQKSGFSGFSEFDSSLTTTENYSRDGGYTEHSRLTAVDRTLKVAYMDWRNTENARASWLRFFNYGHSYNVFVTYEGVTRWARGLLKKMQVSEPTESDYLLKVTLTLRFDDPYWMSVEDFGQDIAIVRPTAGFPWLSPINIGTAAGIFNFSRAVTILNDGDHIAYPKLTVKFTGSVVDPVVSINDGFIKILGTYDEEDVIEIDYTHSPPTVTNNGTNIIGRCDRTSKFDNMYVLIGENVISYDAEEGTDNLSVVFSFNKLYAVI